MPRGIHPSRQQHLLSEPNAHLKTSPVIQADEPASRPAILCPRSPTTVKRRLVFPRSTFRLDGPVDCPISTDCIKQGRQEMRPRRDQRLCRIFVCSQLALEARGYTQLLESRVDDLDEPGSFDRSRRP